MTVRGFLVSLFAAFMLLIPAAAASASSAPGIEVTPASQDYGDVSMYDLKTRSFTITSDGAGPLQVGSISITGSDAGDFSISGTPNCGEVNPGESCQVSVNFQPHSYPLGARSANLVIVNNTPDENPVTVPLTGNAVHAHLTPSSTSIQFGNFDQYDNPTTQSEDLAIYSDGTAPLYVYGNFEGVDDGDGDDQTSGPFSVNGDHCAANGEPGSTGPTDPGESCTLTVQFDPAGLAPGEYSTTLALAANADGLNIPVSATILASELDAPASVDIGDVEIGQSGSAILTLTSTGTAPLKLEPAAITGPDKDLFSIDSLSQCQGKSGGQTCQVTVGFAPDSLGSKSATLELAGNFGDAPDYVGAASIQLSGSGTETFVEPTPAKVSLKLSAPKKAWRGGNVTLTARIAKTGDLPTGPLVLKTVLTKKLASAVKPIRIPALGAGDRAVTKTILIKVKKAAKKAGKLKARFTVSGSGVNAAPATAIWRMRKRPELLYQAWD